MRPYPVHHGCPRTVKKMAPSRQQTNLPIGDIELVFLADVAAQQTDTPTDCNGPDAVDVQALSAHPLAPTDGQEDVASFTDIYRGERPLEQSATFNIDEESSASTSSSNPMNVGRRLGTLATVVEQAISRWARAHSVSSSSDASSTISSSSSAKSALASNRKFGRKRRSRRASTVSLQTVLTEQAIIARKKAREETRFVPRQFVLLLPTNLVGMSNKPRFHGSKGSSNVTVERVTTTTSLHDILQLLEVALKSSAHTIKSQARPSYNKGASSSQISGNQQESASQQKGTKGKSRQLLDVKPDNLSQQSVQSSNLTFADAQLVEKGWWLDVASPSWEDMRALGKVRPFNSLYRCLLNMFVATSPTPSDVGRHTS